MNKREILETKKAKLLSRLAKNPEGRELLAKRNGEAEGIRKAEVEVSKQVSWLIGKLGAYFEDFDTKTNERIVKISKDFATEVGKVERVLAKIADVNESAEVFQELREVKTALKTIAARKNERPVVNVSAPETKVIDNSKTEIVHETKFQEEASATLKTLAGILERVAKNTTGRQISYIENRSPNEFIPVMLVSKDGKRFMDLSDMMQTMMTAQSGGGSAQYQEGQTDSSIVGTAMMWEDTGDTLRAVSAAKPLPVTLVGGGSSGTQYTEGDIDSTPTGTVAMGLYPSDNSIHAVVLDSSNRMGVFAAQSGTWTVGVSGTVASTQSGAWTVAATQSGSWSVTADTELTTADLDTGAGTDTRAVVGMVLAESGGGVLVGSANPLPTSVASLPLPSGAATAANQATEIASLATIDGHVDGIETLLATTNTTLTTIDGHVDGIETLLTTIDGHVDGIETLIGTTNTTLATISGNVDGIETLLTAIDGHVDGVEAYLATLAGTVTSAKVQVDVITIPTVTISGGLTHNNAAPAANNVGVLAALANASTPTFTEGDQVLASVDLSGRMRIQGTGATGSAVPGVAVYEARLNAAGNLEGLRTAASNMNTTTGIATAGLVAVFDDTAPTAITENQFGSLRMSANRNLYGTIRDAAGNERGANVTAANALVVDGSAVTQPVSIAATVTVETELPAAAALADGSATPTAPDVGAKNSIYNGATWDMQRGVNASANTTGVGIPAFGMYAQFDNVSPTTITEGRYGNVRMSANRNLFSTLRDSAGNERGLNISANSAALVEGPIAHDADGTVANPLLQGGYASAAAPTDVSADGDAVRAWHLRNGAQAVAITAAGALIPGDATYGLDVDPTRPAPGLNLSGSAGSLNADAIASTDVSRYSGISVQVGGTFSGTITVQVSNDNSTWFSLPLFDCATTVGAPYSGITGASMSTGSFNFNYLRIRMTSYTSGTANVYATLQASTKAPFTGGFYAFGQGAEGAAPVGNPLNIAARVRTSLPTAEANGDIAQPMIDKYFRTVVVPNSPRDLRAAQTTTLTNTTETTCVTAAGASTYADIEEIILTNTGSAAIAVTFKDATAGTTRFVVEVLPDTTKQIDFKGGWPQATTNANWTATSSSATGDAVIGIVYHKNK